MKKVSLLIISALICGVVFTSCGSNKAKPKEGKTVDEVYEISEWWQPILQKHNLKLGAFNNFDNVFVMGMEGNSINNGVCTLKVATALVKVKDNDNDNAYFLIEADSVYYYIEEGNFDFMPFARRFSTLDSVFNVVNENFVFNDNSNVAHLRFIEGRYVIESKREKFHSSPR